jgi:fermentation-respiration switch protein FrsA (DUF1100 family)
MRVLLIGLGTLGFLYAGVILWFRLNENSLIFFPDRGWVGVPAPQFGLETSRVSLTTKDGVHLLAWAIAPDRTSGRWALILHGNAGNLATPGRPAHARQFHSLGLGVLALDYRGYGESEGSPSEAGLYTDARAAYEYLRDSIGVPAKRIVIYGHSLGSAVAIELASEVPAAGLMIEGAFTSVPDRGGELYPFLPVHWMARSRFPSLERIGAVRMPILVIHGRDDTTIPPTHGRRLFAAAREPKTLLEIPGAHDDAFEVGALEYEAGIRRFLESVN